MSNEIPRFGSRAQYGCLPGFQLHGTNHSLLCSVQGYWLGEVPTCKEIKLTTSSTTSTTQPPPVTIDLTKFFTSSSVDTSLPNTNYGATNRSTESTRNRLETLWSKIPLSTVSQQSTSPSTIYTSTEQPTIFYSSTSRPNLMNNNNNNNNKNKPISSTVKPTLSTQPSNGLSVNANLTPKIKKNGHANKETNYNMKPTIVTKNTNTEKIDGINSFSRKSTSPKAKFNTVGIIALGIFGSFVFLAAVAIIVMIVFRK